MRRLASLLPAGTISVGTGLAVLGAASYIQLAIAGHTLSTAGYSALSVLWSVVFSFGLGLFFPIEQEVSRFTASGLGAGPTFRRGALLAAGLLAVTLVALGLTAPQLSRYLFHGYLGLVAALAAAFVGLAVAHPTRGLLAGTGRFAGYGTQLAVDGVLRVLLTAGLAATGVRDPVWYGLVLGVAPVLSVLATLPAIRSASGPGPAPGWLPLGQGVAPLLVSTLLAQLVVNAAVIAVALIAPAQVALAGALLSALVLVRVPIFVFASVQAALLPGLTELAAGGRRAEFVGLLRRAGLAVGAMVVAGGIPVVLIGPWLIEALFGAQRVLSRVDFTLLMVGTAGYLGALILGQALQALGGHRGQTMAWLAGTAALVAVTLLPGPVGLRVSAGYPAGTLVVCALAAALLVRRLRHPTGPGPTLSVTSLVAAGGAD